MIYCIKNKAKQLIDLTVITAHYKDIKNLIKTYKSLRNQSFKNWKLLIIDSFTPNIFNLLSSEIQNDTRVTILPLESSIYDAMNCGILMANTHYFQILNSGSIYTSNFVLEKTMQIVNDFHNKLGPKLHLFQMEIIDKGKIIFLDKPKKSYFPIQCGHESTIYPNKYRDKILHNQKYIYAADIAFIIDYADKYEPIFHDFTLIRYPKGGDSDTKHNFNKKTFSYLSILKKFLVRIKLIASFHLIIRISKHLMRRIIYQI